MLNSSPAKDMQCRVLRHRRPSFHRLRSDPQHLVPLCAASLAWGKETHLAAQKTIQSRLQDTLIVFAALHFNVDLVVAVRVPDVVGVGLNGFTLGGRSYRGNLHTVICMSD